MQQALTWQEGGGGAEGGGRSGRWGPEEASCREREVVTHGFRKQDEGISCRSSDLFTSRDGRLSSGDVGLERSECECLFGFLLSFLHKCNSSEVLTVNFIVIRHSTRKLERSHAVSVCFISVKVS